MNDLDPFIESMPLIVKTRLEVAEEYGTTTKTLIRRLLKKGVIIPSGNIFPDTCRIVYYKLGVPAKLLYSNGNKPIEPK